MMRLGSLVRVVMALGSISVGFSSTKAEARNLGLGVILFGPTGISGKYLLNQMSSIDGALAWSLNRGHRKFYLHSTYLWSHDRFLRVGSAWLNAYSGAGARLSSWDERPGKDTHERTRLGVRGVAGLGHVFASPGIELFGELALTLNLVPNTDIDPSIAIGARYYF